jgi:FAD/FMN-containing dehydrogenase
MSASEARSIEHLSGKLAGSVMTPSSPEYDATRRVFLGDVDKRPEFIVRAADAEDVVNVVKMAHQLGHEFAVRSGGHSYAGHSTTDGGLVLDVRELSAIEIDTAARTAWAGAGLAAIDLTRATAKHGLAVGLGDTGSVGIAGLTLGGGIGYTVRKHGLTIDSLLGAEIVTADGAVRLVDAEHEPDLFWAIRGGSGNFGVVTRFNYALHDVREVFGGLLVLPATPETIEAYVAAAEAAPEDLSAIANIMPAPPLSLLPPDQVGRLVILAFIVHVGDRAVGEGAMGPFRALATPIVDRLAPMAYPDIYPPGNPDFRPTPVQHAMFLDHVDRASGQTIVDFLEASDASLRAAQLRVLGGAMSRVPTDATAFAHRQNRILASLVNFHDGTTEDRVRRRAWVEEFAAAMHQGIDGVYVNFLGREGDARVQAAYPGPTWERLRAIKRKFDPTNLFRLNQNIPPADNPVS